MTLDDHLAEIIRLHLDDLEAEFEPGGWDRLVASVIEHAEAARAIIAKGEEWWIDDAVAHDVLQPGPGGTGLHRVLVIPLDEEALPIGPHNYADDDPDA